MNNHSVRRINKLLEAMPKPARYLEVGVETGSTFFSIDTTDRTAVDPEFKFDLNIAKATYPLDTYHEVSSDVFFQGHDLNSKFDLVFLDGLHTWDQTYRDFCNTLLCTHDRSVIILDDIFPSDVYSCNRDQVEGMMMRQFMADDKNNAWHGDTYKVIPFLSFFHPTLDYCTIISNGNPQTLLWRASRSDDHAFRCLDDQGTLNTAQWDYLWFLRNQSNYKPMEEEEALGHVITRLSKHCPEESVQV